MSPIVRLRDRSCLLYAPICMGVGSGENARAQLWSDRRRERTRRLVFRIDSVKFRKQQTWLIMKELSRRASVLVPRGVNSLKVPTLRLKRVAGRPSPRYGWRRMLSRHTVSAAIQLLSPHGIMTEPLTHSRCISGARPTEPIRRTHCPGVRNRGQMVS